MSDKVTAQGLAELFGLQFETDKAGNFDESKHPRAPAGDAAGGEFVAGGGDASGTGAQDEISVHQQQIHQMDTQMKKLEAIINSPLRSRQDRMTARENLRNILRERSLASRKIQIARRKLSGG